MTSGCELAAFFLGGVVFLTMFCVGFTAGVLAEQRRIKWEQENTTTTAPPP